MKPETEIDKRPYLSEWQRVWLKDNHLSYVLTSMALIIIHPDQTITRLDPDQFGLWMSGYLAGLSQGRRSA